MLYLQVIMSQCNDCKNDAALVCCGRNICEQCIGSHFMQMSTTRHRPMPLNSSDKIEIISAIHNKIANEILELEEFKNFVLQVMNGFIQSIEKELQEISELLSQAISEKCYQVEQELRGALSHLMVKESQNSILGMFKNCTCLEDIKNVRILTKNLACHPVNLSDAIKKSVQFSLSFEEIEIPSSLPEEPEILEVPNKAEETKSPKAENVPISRRATLQLDPPINRIRAQNFPKPQAPTVYSFVPLTNKIVFYNLQDSLSSELLIDTHIFPPKASWSVSEDSKLILTGGFDEFAKKETFLYNIYDKKVERMPKMLSARYNHAQISIGNFVYVIGGVAAGPLKECERYSLHRKEWSYFASLIVARECPAVCHYSGKIYVVGGVGIESIEYSLINKAKFELLSLRLPGPGRCCIFTYDDQAYILHRAKTFVMAFANYGLRLVGDTEEKDVWSCCEPVVRATDANWVTGNHFMQFHIECQSISVIE